MRLGMLITGIAAGLFATSAASARELEFGTTGNHLLAECKIAQKSLEELQNSDDLVYGTACVSFLAGVREAGAVYRASYRDAAMFCIPRTVTNGQLLQVFVRWAENAPQTLHMERAMLVAAAYMNAWPCE